MTYPVTLAESLAVIGVISPDSYPASATTVKTDPMEMNRVNQLVAVINIGAVAGEVDFKLTQSATSGGTYTLIDDGVAAKQMTQIDEATKQVVISLDASEVGSAKPFVKGELLITTGAADVGVVILGSTARYDPASDFDLDSVAQIIK